MEDNKRWKNSISRKQVIEFYDYYSHLKKIQGMIAEINDYLCEVDDFEGEFDYDKFEDSCSDLNKFLEGEMEYLVKYFHCNVLEGFMEDLKEKDEDSRNN